MAMTINTNINSLNAQRNAQATQMSLSTSIQRLSSGLRVNSAKDDAAGIAIVHGGIPAPLAIAIAGAAAAAVGLTFGYPALRLRGPYFAVGMLGVAEAIRVAVTVAEPVTGGGKGLVLPPEDVLDAEIGRAHV